MGLGMKADTGLLLKITHPQLTDSLSRSYRGYKGLIGSAIKTWIYSKHYDIL